MIRSFADDDAGFVRWRDTHPDGFIVNHELPPKPSYLVLHSAPCGTLAGDPKGRGTNWTSALGKTCGDSVTELRAWAQRVGGDLDPCRLCGP